MPLPGPLDRWEIIENDMPESSSLELICSSRILLPLPVFSAAFPPFILILLLPCSVHLAILASLL